MAVAITHPAGKVAPVLPYGDSGCASCIVCASPSLGRRSSPSAHSLSYPSPAIRGYFRVQFPPPRVRPRSSSPSVWWYTWLCPCIPLSLPALLRSRSRGVRHRPTPVAKACNAPLSSHSHALPRLPKKHIVAFETGCAIVGLQEDRSLYPLRLAPPLRLHVLLVRFPLCPHRLVDILSIFYRPCWIRQRRRVAFDTPTMKGRRGLYWSSR